jgi:hypothetical protein
MGNMTRFVLMSDSCRFVHMGGGGSLRKDGLVVYNHSWTSTVQSFSGLNPVGLVTIFCLEFEIPGCPRCRCGSIPKSRVAQLYIQALGSFYIVSYDSQGYEGGIQTIIWGRRTVPWSLTSEVMSWLTVSRPICLGVRQPSGTCDQFFFSFPWQLSLDSCGFVIMGSPVLYSCCWTSPV